MLKEKYIEARKKGDFSFNLSDHDFLHQFNQHLAEFDEKLLQSINTDEAFPNIFILGLPRSGTTLLSQVILNSLDVGCTNNLVARFWKAPLSGLYLSKICLADAHSTSFHSNYGKTKDISGPHEFSWFWHDLLRIDDIECYNPEESDSIINWRQARDKLLAFNNIIQKPLVHKPLELVAYHAQRFSSLFNHGIFIYIERDPLEIACSLAGARKTYYGNYETWWGSYPPGYEDSTSMLPWTEQIAWQVQGLMKLYKETNSQYPPERFLSCSYKEICQQPSEIITKIKNISKNYCSYDLKQINSPSVFSPSQGSLDEQIRKELASALKLYSS